MLSEDEIVVKNNRAIILCHLQTKNDIYFGNLKVESIFREILGQDLGFKVFLLIFLNRVGSGRFFFWAGGIERKKEIRGK